MMHDQTNQGGRQNYHRVAAEVLDEERAGPLISLALIVFPTKRSYLPIPKVPGVRTLLEIEDDEVQMQSNSSGAFVPSVHFGVYGSRSEQAANKCFLFVASGTSSRD